MLTFHGSNDFNKTCVKIGPFSREGKNHLSLPIGSAQWWHVVVPYNTNLPLVASSIALVPHLPAFLQGERAVVFSINQDLFRFRSLPLIFFLPLHYIGEVIRYCTPFVLIFHHLCIYRLPALRTLPTSSSAAFLRYLHCEQMSTACSVGLEVQSELLYISFPLIFSCFN